MITEIKDMNIEDLWQEYILGKNPNIKDEIISRNVPYARSIAINKSKSMNMAICPVDDLISASYMALVRSFDQFEPDYGYSIEYNRRFTAYITKRISGAIVDEFRKFCWAPTRSKEKNKKDLMPVFFGSIEHYNRQNNHDMNDVNMDDAIESGLDEDEIIFGLDSIDYIHDFQDDCFDLTEEQKNIMHLFYIKDLNTPQIAEHLDQTVAYVHNRKVAALKKIRDIIRKRSSEQGHKISDSFPNFKK